VVIDGFKELLLVVVKSGEEFTGEDLIYIVDKQGP
jgi:hypothetical protein